MKLQIELWMGQCQFRAPCLRPLPSSAQSAAPPWATCPDCIPQPGCSSCLPSLAPVWCRASGWQNSREQSCSIPSRQDPWKAVSLHGVGKVYRESPQRLVKLFTLKPLHPEGDWALNRLLREVVRAPRLPELKSIWTIASGTWWHSWACPVGSQELGFDL